MAPSQESPETQRPLPPHLSRLLRCLAVLVLTILPLLALRGLAPTGTLPSPAVAATEPLTLVINEVAWGGTAADPADEWIELYNNTAFTLPLAGWTLSSLDAGLHLALDGAIGPYAHFLIEAGDDTTISDIPADLLASFGTGLANEGESVLLRDPAGTVVDSCNHNGGPWPTGTAGAAPLYLAMERMDPKEPDYDLNWLSNDGTALNGRDALGNPIRGTPRSPNSVYLPIHVNTPDLWVTQEGPAELQPGSLLTYTIRVRNRGGEAAPSTWLTDSLQAPDGIACTPSPPPARRLGAVWVWSLGDLLPAAEFRVTMACATTPAALGVLTSTAEAHCDTLWELYADNNLSVLSVAMPPPAPQLLLEKRGPAALPPAGQAVTYTITLTNRGAAPALAVHLTDTLPSALAFVSQTASAGVSFAAQPDPALLVWEAATLESGAAVTVTLSAIVLDARLTAVNAATASALGLAEIAASWESARLPGPVLIAGVLFDGYQDQDADEAVQLVNTDIFTTYLAGWELCKDSAGYLICRVLPSLALAPGQRVWIARNAAAFARSFGAPPDAVPASWLELANTGDEVLLRNDQHQAMDALVYGDGGAPLSGWQGSPLQRYENSLRGLTGQILSRIPDERTGLPARDTDTRADWIQDPDNPLEGRRVLYPGWDLDPLFWPATGVESATVHIGIAPDNAYALVAETLSGARRTITMEAYLLTHPDIITTLAERARAGVSVTLLLEGNPVGIGTNTSPWHTQLYACATLESLGGQCAFMIHDPDAHIYNRYEALHSKLALIDETWAIIGTQNLTYDGMPSDPKDNGTYGSRGIVLVTDAPLVVQRAQQLLNLDLDASHSDILPWDAANPEPYGSYAPDLVELSTPDWTTATVRFSEPTVLSGTLDFELLTAPEAALRQTDGLLGLLARAGFGDTVLAEQLYEHADWGTVPVTMPNLRLEAMVAAARRGARVRLLLNGMGFVPEYPVPPPENVQTVAYLNGLARDEGLDLRAALGNPSGGGIHSKSVLVDLADGAFIHIGSINGSEASSKVNRELALQIGSQAAYAALARLFGVDWSLANPIYLPVLFRMYTTPPPPVNHLVFSEVYYATSDIGLEWVEIYNPTAAAVDLSAYKVGDAETPERYEGMYSFPPGTLLPPGAVIVVAGSAARVPQADVELFDPLNLNPTPNMLHYWGTGEWTLANAADQVLLLGPDDRPVDIIVWGSEPFAGIAPHPGVLLYTHSLQRYPVIYDTDDCSVDFHDWPIPSPGDLSDVLP